MAAPSKADDIQTEATRTLLTNGDFVSLFSETSDYSGFISQETISASLLTVYPQPTQNSSPPNFQQNCVFQIFVANEEVQPGESISYGDKVVLLHRASQKFVTKSKLAIEVGFQAALESIRPMPPYVRGADVGEEDGTGELDDAPAAGGDEKKSAAALFPSAALFTLIPRFKINAFGDNIRLTDQVTFESCESTASTRWYLTSFPNEPLCISNVKNTGIRTRLFAPFGVSSEAFRHVVKGGDFIRLFHHELNGFLCIGNATDQYGFVGISATALFLRLLAEDGDAEDVHDAGSVWQIELENTFQSGGRPVQWGDRVRLKNLLNGMYLDVSGGAFAERLPSSLVAVTDVSTGDDIQALDVPYRSYSYIAGSSSQGKSWMYVEGIVTANGDSQVDSASNTGAPSDFLPVKFSAIKKDENAFEIMPVSITDIREFFFAEAQRKRLVPLQSLRYNTIAETDPRFKDAKLALRELILFCTNDDPTKPTHEHDGEAISSHQVILLDLDIDDLLMTFCYTMFDLTKRCDGWSDNLKHEDIPTFNAFNLIGLDTMRLFRQMSKDNPRVGTHLARKYRDTLTNMCLWLAYISEVTWNVADGIQMMFMNNAEMLQEVSEDYVKLWLKMMNEGTLLKDVYQYLALMSSFCVNKGAAVRDAQDSIRRILLHANMVLPKLSVSPSGQLLITTRFEDITKQNFAFKNWEIRTMPLAQFVEANEADSNVMHDVESNANYLENVLTLLAALCKGRNIDSQREVRTFVTVPVILGALRDAHLADNIKAAFCSLFVQVYVDSDPLEDQTLLHSRSWEKLDDPRSLQRARVEISNLLGTVDGNQDGQFVLLNWIEQYFEVNHDTLLKLTAEKNFRNASGLKKGKPVHLSREEKERHAKAMNDEVDRNTLTYRLLQVVEHMVRFGFFHNPERGKQRRDKLLATLLNMLRASHGKFGHKDTASHKIIMKAKMEACDTISNLMVYELKGKLTGLLLNFKEQMRHVTANHHLSQKPPEQLTLQFANEQDNKLIFEWFARFDCSPNDFCEVIMDLCSYEYDKLRLSALNLLVKSFSGRAELIRMVQEVRIVADYSEDEFKMDSMQRLRQMAEFCESDKLTPQVIGGIREIMDGLARKCITAEQLETFATKLASAKTGGQGFVDDRTPLRVTDAIPSETLPMFLSWTAPTTELKMSRSLQDILRELKAHAQVLSFLNDKLNSKDEAAMTQHLAVPENRELYKSCFRFLRLWSQSNVKNKMILAKTSFKFISKCCKLGVAAAETLFRILKDNPAAYDINRNVNVQMIHIHADNFVNRMHCRSSSYLRLLEALVTRKGRADVSRVKALLEKLMEKPKGDKKDLRQSAKGRRRDMLYNRDPRFDYARAVARPNPSAAFSKFKIGQDYAEGRFIEFIVSIYDEMGAVTTEDLLHQEYYLHLVRLLSVCCETADETVRKRVRKDIPLAMAALPLASANSKNVPLEIKSTFIKFLLETYFPFGEQSVYDGGEQSAQEFLEAAKLLARICTSILNSFSADYGRMQHQISANDRKTKQYIDPYIFKRAIPLTTSILTHLNRQLASVQDDLRDVFGQLTNVCKDMFASLRRLLEARIKLDERDPRFYIDMKGRETAAKSLKHLVKLYSSDSSIMALVMDSETVTTFTSVRDYFANQQQREAMKSIIVQHSGTTKGKHSHTHSHKPSGGHGTHTGQKKGTNPTGRGLVMPAAEKVATPTESLMDEKINFAKQVQTILSAALTRKKAIRWMKRLSCNIDFKEFWTLVDFLRHQICSDAKLKQTGEAHLDEEHPGAVARNDSKTKVSSNAVHPEQVELIDMRHGKEVQKKKSFDITVALGKIITHFKSIDPEDGINEDDALSIARFCDVLCGLITPEVTPRDDILEVTQRLNSLHFPSMLLQLATLPSDEAASRSLQMAILMLLASPTENSVETHANNPHSQQQFLLCFNEPTGRKALAAFIERFQAEAVVLTAEEEGGDDDEDQQDKSVQELVSEARLSSYVVTQILQLVRLFTLGCYKEAQDLLRQTKVVNGMYDLASALSSHYAGFISEDFKLYDESKADSIFAIYSDLSSMLSHCTTVLELSNAISSVSAGPNRENQKELVYLGICDPLLVSLSFMEFASTDRSTIDVFRDEIQHQLHSWKILFGVTTHAHDHTFGQASTHSGSGLRLSTNHLSIISECGQLLEELAKVDRRCEESVLQALFGLIEARFPGDEAYDLVAQSVFPEFSSNNSVSGDVVMSNLRHHYSALRREEVEEQENVKFGSGDEKFNLAQTTLSYFMLVKVLGDEAAKTGSKIRRKLREWETAESVNLRSQIGRIEVVKDDNVQVVYFPIPDVARETRKNLVVEDLQAYVTERTILLPPEQKIAEFLPQCEIVADIVKRQAFIQHDPPRRFMSQFPWAWISFWCSVIINIYTIFNQQSMYKLALVLGFVNIGLLAMVFATYFLNTLPIDQHYYKAYEVGNRPSTIKHGVSQLFFRQVKFYIRFLTFWLNTRACYILLSLAFAIMGVSISLRFFAFHLFDIAFRVKTVGFVIQAIVTNMVKLGAAFLLLFLMIYAYMLIGQSAFPGQYVFGAGQVECSGGSSGDSTNLAYCLRDSLYYGYQAAPNFSVTLPNLGALIFCLAYFILVVQIMTAVVSGIIIDSFARLRGNSDQIQDMKDNTCYICSYTRDVLDPVAKNGFPGHIKIEHPQWHYVYYFIYLDEKLEERKTLTGMDIYFLKRRKEAINGKIERLVAVLPIKRAVCKEKDGRSDEISMGALLAAVQQAGSQARTDLVALRTRLEALLRKDTPSFGRSKTMSE